jgi:hypothetical protein
MTFGEDRSKVSNIVKCQMEHFRSLYEPVIKSLDQWVDVDFLSGKAEQDVSPSAKLYHLNLLPKTLQVGHSYGNFLCKSVIAKGSQFNRLNSDKSAL